MSQFQYFCDGTGDSQIKDRLREIDEKWQLEYQLVDLSQNGEHDFGRNREVYKRDFKPRARILKRRTGESIT